MPKLILLGGPTGVGKTTTLRLLEKKLPDSGVLDADDVWRISDSLAVEGTRKIAIANVVAVMRGYFQAGCQTGVLSWVFARPLLFEPVIAGLEDVVDSVHFLYLIASTEVLEQRLAQRQDSHKFDYSLSRLDLIAKLPYANMDTSELSPEEVADSVIAYISQLDSRHS